MLSLDISMSVRRSVALALAHIIVTQYQSLRTTYMTSLDS